MSMTIEGYDAWKLHSPYDDLEECDGDCVECSDRTCVNREEDEETEHDCE